jgi:hypothetical protein
MNNFLISIMGIIIFTSSMSLISKFFDIDMLYYLPFMMWITALFLFNIFLDKKPSNIFMKDIRNV